jgi:NAD(P)H-dependent FMN reductase
MQADLKLAVLIGSTRRGRFGPTVANWFEARAREHGGFEVDVIDLVDAALPHVLIGYSDPTPEAVTALESRLAAADGFVVVTPEYNHSFPASLKTAIDWFREEWQAKPVAFVSYGGISGGLRAVEHLRTVFAEMHATTIRETVSFHNAWSAFDHGADSATDGADAAAKKLLDQLAWWSHALRNHRTAHPYAS